MSTPSNGSEEFRFRRCPVSIWSLTSDSTGHPLNALDLAELAKSTIDSFWLRFSIPYTTGSSESSRELEFLPNHDLLSDHLKSLPSTTSVRKQTCHFESVDPEGGHSALSACSAETISGFLRLSGKVYFLSHDYNGFFLIPQGGSSCEFPTGLLRSRRSPHIISSFPDYYADYLDGIKRYVELVFIVDNSVYKKYNENETKIHDRLHTIASVVNSLYSPLNIRVTLVWADIWKTGDPFEVTQEADKTLTNFVNYRKTFLQDHPHDNAHLITDVQFGSVIGKAYRGTMCSYDYSGGVIVDHSEHPAFVGGTVAHEMGHNFGMDHDAGYPDPCKCTASTCIMAPASSNINATTFFSDCSLEFLDHAIKRGVDYCLRNVPKAAFGGAKCGNGILEQGEDCDCGSTVYCPNKCCIASECKLNATANAVCADGDCCDTSICQPKAASTVCRGSTNSCDLAEYCDGKNPSCPADFYVQDGHSCPDSLEDYCYRGSCGSRNKQCQFIWGPTGKSSVAECYDYNDSGTMSGNCGYDQRSSSFAKCTKKDVTCGRLQCQQTSEKPVFGDPSTVTWTYNYARVTTNNGFQDVPCRAIKTTYTGVGKKQPDDPGMVLDGANCGPDKMCVGAKCRERSEVLQMVSKCEPSNCNGKGICNNVGNCHCVNGYGGVACDIPGYGGSVNSGPAHDKVFNPGLVLLYVFTIVLVSFVIATVYCKRKKNFWLHKRIWKQFREALNIRSILVPIRKAPPPPGTQIRHMHRSSLSAAWGDFSAPSTDDGNILRVNAANPIFRATDFNLRTTENPLATYDVPPVADHRFEGPPIILSDIVKGTSNKKEQNNEIPYLANNPANKMKRLQANSSFSRSTEHRALRLENGASRSMSSSPDEQQSVEQRKINAFANREEPPQSAIPKQNTTKELRQTRAFGQKAKPKPPSKPPVVLNKQALEGGSRSNDESGSMVVSVKDLAAKFDSKIRH